VWEGKKIVDVGRQMLGATDPLKSNPGTIRGDFGIDVGRLLLLSWPCLHCLLICVYCSFLHYLLPVDLL